MMTEAPAAFRPIFRMSAAGLVLAAALAGCTVGTDHVAPMTTLAPFHNAEAVSARKAATPALASLDRDGRVIHIGSFSKTISPTVRLGFLVAPVELISRFAEAAACLAPPPVPVVQ